MPITKLQSPRDFFRIWFFWKAQAVIAFLVIVGLVMFYAYTCTPKYKSSAKIVLLPSTSEESVISAGIDRQQILPVSEQQVNTEMELICSDNVLRDTVKSFEDSGMGLEAQDKGPFDIVIGFFKTILNKALVIIGLKPGPPSPFEYKVELLRDSLEIESTPDSNIIFVTLWGENPKATAIVLNRLLDIYVQYHNKVFTQEGGVQFFDEKSAEYDRNLREAEERLKKLQKNSSIVNLRVQNETNIELLGELTKRLNYMEISYDEAASRINILQSALAKNKKSVVITKEMRIIPAIVELEKAIVPLLVKRSEIRKTYTITSREYREIDNQIETLRSEIRKEIEKAINTDRLELESLQAKKESLQKRINRLKQEAIDLDQKEKELKAVERQVKLYKNNYMLYASKTEDARIYAERAKRNLANISIADRAHIPEKPDYPNRLLFLFLSVFFGLFIAICLPFVLESFDHRLKTPNDVEALLSLPVICSFPDK